MGTRQQIERRQRRLARQQERKRALDYYARQSGAWALSDAELAELDSLVARIERAQRAQQQHDRRTDVQLRLAEVA